MKTTLYKTIFFDWNKTLSYSRFWQQFENPSHPHYDAGRNVFNFLFKERRDLITPWMRGQKTTADILDEVSESTKTSTELLRAELKYSCEKMTIEPESVLGQIQQLRNKGIRCVIATDNMDTFRDYTIPALGLADLFDDFLISNELGVLKFDVDSKNAKIPFFDEYLSSKGLGYSDVVLVDDCVDDGFYADAGFHIMQVHKPNDLTKHMQTLLQDAGTHRKTLSRTVDNG